MLTKLKIPVLFGLSTYGIAYTVVNFLGFTSSSFTILAYLYISLSIVIGIYYEIEDIGGFRGFLDNIVVVIEGEEMKLKKLITGEKYKLKGEIEKIE